MAAAYVQSNSMFQSGSDTGWSSAFTSNVVSGNLIVVAVGGIQAGTPTNYTVSDTLGTTYSSAVTTTASIDGNPFRVSIFYGIAPSGGANTVFASHASGTTYTRLAVHEYSGVDSVDETTSATGHSLTVNAGNMTTTQADEVIFGWLVSNAGMSSAGTGYTQRQAPGSEITVDQIVTATGTYAPEGTAAGNEDWVALGVAFGLGLGGGDPGPDPVDTDPIVTAIGPTTNATTVNVGGDMVIDTPENHGAKRDGRMVQGTYTATGRIFTLDSAVPVSRQFTSADEGKVFILRNPTPGTTVVTTVDSVTDATHCVLASGPSSNYAATFAVLGTDDTAAVAAAVSYATSFALEAGLNTAKVALTEGIYVMAGPTVKTTTTLGNAQIPLPVLPAMITTKFTLEICGPINTATPIHWAQTTPNLTGAVLFSALLAQSSDGIYGNPSIIGGPTPQALGNIGAPTGWGTGASRYSNLHVILRNFMVATPVNTTYGGFDLRHVATANIDGVALLPFDTAGNFASASGAQPPNTEQVAVYMPFIGNNDLCEIGMLTVYYWHYGLAVTDHVNIQTARFIFCNSGILIAGPSGSDGRTHGWHADYISAEGCKVAIDATVFKSETNGAANFPTTIDHMDTEVIGDYQISDPNNFLTGYMWAGNGDEPGKLKVNGAGNMQIRSFFEQRGPRTTPTIPATDVAFLNPFWRDVAVTVTGTQVTGIAVAGTALGVAGGTVIVPSGKSITLTYSGGGSAPAWTWIAL